MPSLSRSPPRLPLHLLKANDVDVDVMVDVMVDVVVEVLLVEVVVVVVVVVVELDVEVEEEVVVVVVLLLVDVDVEVDEEVVVVVELDVEVVASPHSPSLSGSFGESVGQESTSPHMPSSSTSFSASYGQASTMHSIFTPSIIRILMLLAILLGDLSPDSLSRLSLRDGGAFVSCLERPRYSSSPRPAEASPLPPT